MSRSILPILVVAIACGAAMVAIWAGLSALSFGALPSPSPIAVAVTIPLGLGLLVAAFRAR